MMRKGYLIALALVLAVNVVVLAGVAYNRSGTPKSRMVLTARELPLSWSFGEFGSRSDNSGMSVYIDWQSDQESHKSLLTREKLMTLGFRYPADAQRDDRGYKQLLDRKAYVVLEYNGAAWEAYLQQKRDKHAEALAEAQSEQQRKSLEQQQEFFERTSSRLKLVDIGPNATALRARYADGGKYLITQARVSAYHNYTHTADKANDEIRAQIVGLLPHAINVPRPYHAAIQQAEKERRRFNWKYDRNNIDMPGYKITLVYGQRNEPWIEAVTGK